MLNLLFTLIFINDNDTLFDTLFALKSILKEEKDEKINDRKIDYILDSGIFSKIIDLLDSPNVAMRKLCIELIANISSNQNKKLEAIAIEEKLIDKLNDILFVSESTKESIREIFFIASNLVAESGGKMIPHLVESGLYKNIINYVTQHPCNAETREGIWAVVNVIESSDEAVRINLEKEFKLSSIFANLLKSSKEQPTIIKVLILATTKILNLASSFSKFTL